MNDPATVLRRCLWWAAFTTLAAVLFYVYLVLESAAAS